jgi:tetratricopeptide (TPR) repeat protein
MALRTPCPSAVQRAVVTPHTLVVNPPRGTHVPAAAARGDVDTAASQPQQNVWSSLLQPAGYSQPAAVSTSQSCRHRWSASNDLGPFSLTACAWEMLLRGAEDPTEFSRSDRRQRSRTRYAHHRAARPSCSKEEMDLHMMAMYRHRKGRTREAIKLLKSGMSMYPNNCFFATSLGSIYSKQGKHKQAEEFLEQALVDNPENSVVLNALAGVKAKLGDADHARQLFERAVDVRPCSLALPAILYMRTCQKLASSSVVPAGRSNQCASYASLGCSRKEATQPQKGATAAGAVS